MINNMLTHPKSIEDIMNKYEVGWILKEEDKKLKSHNRNNHDKEYTDKGISIKKLNQNTLLRTLNEFLCQKFCFVYPHKPS